jgi:hypothetical protein
MVLRIVSTSLLLFSTITPAAQLQNAAPAPPTLIDRLVANAEQYRATLPSLTADETIDSDGAFMGIFKEHATAQGTFRAIRTAPGASLDESRQITILNGKPVEPGRSVGVPFTLSGGFGRFQEMFFTPQHRACFAFELLPDPGPAGALQITISVPPDLWSVPSCSEELHGLTGLVRVAPQTFQITHLERTVTEQAAAKFHLAIFASVDLAPTQVGDETFWLPTTVVGHIINGRNKGQFVAHYSNYHRYTASISLLPNTTQLAPAQPSSTPP